MNSRPGNPRAGNSALYQVAVDAVLATAPSVADTLVQANTRVSAIKIKALHRADDAGTDIDPSIDQGGDQDIDLVMHVGATRSHELTQVSEYGIDQLVRRTGGECVGDRWDRGGNADVFGGSHDFGLSEKLIGVPPPTRQPLGPACGRG